MGTSVSASDGVTGRTVFIPQKKQTPILCWCSLEEQNQYSDYVTKEGFCFLFFKDSGFFLYMNVLPKCVYTLHVYLVSVEARR